MPITNLSSWLPTTQQFINHWTQVNTELGGGGPLSLLGPYVVAGLTTDRTTLDGLMTAVVAADNTSVTTRGDFDLKNAALLERLKQFRGACRAYLPASIYEFAPPTVPPTNTVGDKFIRAYDDMSNVWTQINASPPSGFTGPLLLAGGFTLANFNTALAALRTSYVAYTNAVENAGIARTSRNLLMNSIFQHLKQYRGAAVSRLPSSSPLLTTIPALSAPAGSTPDPVNLSASWNEDTKMADLVWSASADPNFDHYEIRYHPGPKYKAAEEQSVDASNETEFATDYGLAANGSVAWYKVYVVTSFGNEKGSNAVKVIRTSD